ncbi:MAG: hypothetical protein COZ05_21515 [Armatimonadetes bacterium CG_4_10_14_3_um_filter_59_10]|nr:MAG: hypothetical protein COZ05_21515 [Armatimonadetes bacterium CG_4_10_14_3_um_filter_59_10]
MPRYAETVNLPISYEEAVSRTRGALKDEGFGVITEIDVKATMKEKLNEDVAPYVILGACNPSLAHRALSTEKEIGLLLPCNVCVWDNGDGSSTVAAINVKEVFQVMDNPALVQVAETVTNKLASVLQQLQGVK